MANTGAAASMQPLDYLKYFERRWRPHLESVSLVTEALTAEAITPDRALKAVNALGRAYATKPSGRLFESYPVCTVVGFAAVAADGYHGGSLWPSIWARVPFPADAGDQDVWGAGFLDSLDALSLPRFTMPRKYVGNILMHSGIPTYCLSDFYRLLDMATRARGRSVDDVLAWLYPRLGTSSIPDVDKPVERFIQFGGDFAADLLDRCIDMLARLRRDDALDGLGLPDRFVDKARAHVLSNRAPAIKGGVRGGSRPELRLDPWSARLQLALPPVPDAPESFCWQISDGDDIHVVRPRFDWSSGSYGAAASVFDVSKHVTQLHITETAGGALSIDVDVVTPTSPVLFFDEAGRRIPDGRPLPPAPVWVLRPAADEYRLTYVGQPYLLASASSPLGWATWVLESIDLTAVTSVTGAGLSARPVRGLSRSHIDLVDLRDDVTYRGLPVCSSRPRVVLPAGHEFMGTWTVSVRDADSGVVLRSATDFTEDPFAGWDGPVIGDFEIVVRGPLGRGALKRVVVVEGLGISVDPQTRAFTAAGLQPAVGKATAAPCITLQPESFTLAGDQVSLPLHAHHGTTQLALNVSPRAMAVSLVQHGTPEAWSYGPARLTTESLSGAELLVRIPGADLKLPVHLERHGQRLQSLDAQGALQPGLLRYSLTQCADTATAAGSGSFVLDTPTGTLPLAAFRPKDLTSGIDLDDDRLVLRDFAGGDVECVIWSLGRPWLGSCSASVAPDGSVPLAAEWLQAPPLAVMVRPVDPWIPQPSPALPDPGSVLLAGADIGTAHDLYDIDTPERAVATWQLWHALRDVARGLKPHGLDELVRRVLREHPDALYVLAGSDLSQAHKLRLLIESQAAARTSPASLTRDSDASSLWRTEPVLAALLSCTALASADAPTRLPVTWDAFASTVGDSGVDVLATGHDGDANAGRFGPSERLLSSNPATFEAVMAQLDVVPRRFLDRDARFLGALQLFRALRTSRLGPTSKVAAAATAGIRRALDAAGREHAVAAIDARIHPDDHEDWTALPAMSMAMALAARYGARRVAGLAEPLAQYSAYWLVLTKTAPKLVAIDLVLAELHAAGDFAQARPALRSQEEDETQ